MTHTYRKSLPSILTPVSGSKVWKTYETTVYIRHYEYKAEHERKLLRTNPLERDDFLVQHTEECITPEKVYAVYVIY